MASGPGMSVVDEFVEAGAGLGTLLRCWRPDTYRATVAIVHDRDSHRGDYRRFAEALGVRGIAACAVDLRASAQEAGARFRLRALDGDLREVAAMMARIRERDPLQPLFLFGHGTGAVLACLHALQQRSELAGMLCEGVMLGRPGLATILSTWVRHVPGLSLLPALALPRVHERLRQSLGELSWPLLVLHGSENAVAPLSGSEYLHGRAGSCNKTLQVFEGCGHDLVNDRGHEIAREKCCAWIEAQLSAGTSCRHIGIEYINEQP